MSYINYYENLPRNWESTNICNVITLTSGTDLKPENYSSKNIGIPYLTGASNIENNNIIVNRYTTVKYVNSHLNEILLTCKGTVGKIVLNNLGDIHVARQFMSIKCFINNNFFVYFLQTIVQKLEIEAKSIIPGIDRKQLLLKKICLPPREEQNRIVLKLNLLLKII